MSGNIVLVYNALSNKNCVFFINIKAIFMYNLNLKRLHKKFIKKYLILWVLQDTLAKIIKKTV